MSRHEIFRVLALGLAPAAVAGAGPLPPCSEPVGNCQLPDQLGHGAGALIAAASDANPASGFSARDNVVIDDGGTINSICWTGIYLDFAAQADCGPGAVLDQFTVTYYQNIEGLPPAPGAVVGGPFDLTASLVKEATGNVVPSDFGDIVEFEFSATHPDVVVPAGTCLWIEIRNDTTGSDPACIWLWSTAPSFAEGGIGDALSWQNDIQNDFQNDFDLAFCLNLPLGDPTACDLQIDPGCEGALNPCSQISPDPGCSDQECCTLVCDPLPFCCLLGWDIDCVDVADALCGDCGETGAGNCFAANFTPFCDDQCGAAPCVGCCQLVCAVDPFCCEDPRVGWDGLCAFEAMQLCSCEPGQAPVNDDCENAIAIGLGDTPVDNTCATSSTPNHATCNDGFLNGLGLDIWYSYVAEFTGQLLVSTCGQVNYDTQLAVYEGCDCFALSDPPLACNNEGAVCPPGTSLLIADVVQGTCYLIRLGSGSIKPVGSGTLTLSSTVPPVCDLSPFPPGALPEGEQCGDDTNGGCDSPLPEFTIVQIGDVIHGTAWAVGGQRDTDWFELVLTEATEVSLNLDAEFPFLLGFVETLTPGSGDCADTTGSVVPSETGETCTTGVVTVVLDPGTWWPFVRPLILDGLPCPEGITAGNDYVLSITGIAPCPWDCGDGDGVVGIVDFLALLGEWAMVQTPCDMGLGAAGVGIEEFLDMLGHWGPCP
ncbi:MAG: hypothetical protein IID28_05730 [Planctomycetes bacterium]|nr:hypothetical protein [Planctomycetota bacterium]